MKKKKFWVWLVIIGIILAAVFFFLPLPNILLDRDDLLVWVQQWGPWAPLVTITLHIFQVITAPIPGTALDAVNGLLFGPWLGTLYSMIGLITGSWLAMLLARRFGRPLVERYVQPAIIARFDALIKKHGSLFIFFVFLIPFLPDDAICFLAGLTPIPIVELVLLAILGRLPGVFVANLLGSHAGSLALWQWVLLIGVFVILLIFFWQKRKELSDRLLGGVEDLSEKVKGLFGGREE